MPALYGWLGGEWRRAHTIDAWDAANAVWREVRELWAHDGAVWRQIYRRAFLNNPTVTELGGDPLTYSVTVPIGGIASGPVTCVVRVNGTVVAGGSRAVPSTVTYGITGTAGPDTIDVQLFNPLGRLLGSQVLL